MDRKSFTPSLVEGTLAPANLEITEAGQTRVIPADTVMKAGSPYRIKSNA